MSFSEICDKFEPVVFQLRKGEKSVSALCNLFKSYRKAIEICNTQFQKAVDIFRLELPKESNLDTLSTALNSMTDYCTKIIQHQGSYVKNLSIEVIEPLDLFLSQFITSCNELANKGHHLLRDTSKLREKNQKTKEKYYQTCEQLEKAERAEKSCFEENKEKFEKLQKSTALQRLQVAKCLDMYNANYRELEQSCDRYDANMPGIMESLQKSNESRIHFIKYSLEKHTKSHLKCLQGSKETIEDFAAIISNINSNIDIRVFVDINKSKFRPLREEFIMFDQYLEIKNKPKVVEEKVKEDEYEVIESNTVKQGEDPDAELVEKVLEHLLPNDSENQIPANSLDPIYYSRISELLHTPDGRGLFCDILESRRALSLLTYSKATQLAALIKSFLTSMMIQGDNDSAVFCKIVVLAHVFYTEDELGKRKYLTHFLENHAIWQEQSRWIEAIEAATDTKIQLDMEYSKSLPKKKKGLLSIIKNIGKAAFQKDADEERIGKLVAFMIMGQFNFHMIHLGLPQEISTNIVLTFCKKVELDQERTCNLLAELQANQKINTKHDKYKISLLAREKEKSRWDKLLPIGLALDFMRPDECFELRLVNRAWNNTLRVGIFKKWLLEWDSHLAGKKKLRNMVWVDILKAESRPLDYFSILSQSIVDQHLIKGLSEIIDIDVARSYQGNDLMPPQLLKNILKSFAFYNQEVGYCQGMNYIVGTIYLQVQDEALAFKILVALIDKFQMKNLFISSLPKLKQFFYQLDRIIGLFLPELHEKFKEISICSGHFSSSWFITLYSSILQNKPNILYKVWDMFILDGWKTIFKVAVVMLAKLSRSIVAGRFEDIMMILTNFQLVNLGFEMFDEDFIPRVQTINISNALLRDLESEYEHLKLKASTSSKILYT